jgi:hypothetical protein
MRKLLQATAKIPDAVFNPEVLGIGGMITLTAGLWMWSMPVALIVLGVILMGLALLKGRGRE